MAATAQISRQSRFFFTTTAWEEFRSIFPNIKLKMKPSPPDICNTWDATATDSSKPRFIVWNATQNMATSRIIAMRSAAVGSVCARRRMSRTNSRSCTATNGGACFTPTPFRRCSLCTNDRHPRTIGLATGLPRFSAQSQSSNFPSYSIMAHFSFDACPLSRDAAAYLLLECLLG